MSRRTAEKLAALAALSKTLDAGSLAAVEVHNAASAKARREAFTEAAKIAKQYKDQGDWDADTCEAIAETLRLKAGQDD